MQYMQYYLSIILSLDRAGITVIQGVQLELQPQQLLAFNVLKFEYGVYCPLRLYYCPLRLVLLPTATSTTAHCD
jgi:hypothetical protein